jgi:hypothetical protein
MALIKLNNQSLTAVTSAGLPSGSVLQVVQGVFQNTSSTTSTSAVATGLTATITPQNASSEILINVFGSSQLVQSGTTNVYPLYKNGSVLDAGFMLLSNPIADGEAMSASYLDSPATTSATTYALYMYTNASGYTASFGSNSGSIIYRNSITLTEIAG